MQKPVNIADRRELFVDDVLTDRLDNTRLVLHEPWPAGMAIRIDRPWEGPGNFGLSVLKHRGRYHLYYRCCDTVDGVRRRTMARAVSKDLAGWSDSVVCAAELACRAADAAHRRFRLGLGAVGRRRAADPSPDLLARGAFRASARPRAVSPHDLHRPRRS